MNLKTKKCAHESNYLEEKKEHKKGDFIGSGEQSYLVDLVPDPPTIEHHPVVRVHLTH